MPSVNVTIRMDQKDKEQLEKLLSEFGLTMNAGFNLFAKQVIREQGIPFEITKNVGIQYLDRKKLTELSEKSDKKYHKAYEVLGKWAFIFLKTTWFFFIPK